MPDLDKTTQKRITFLSLLSSAATYGGEREPYDLANYWLQAMEEDGFFEAAPAARPTQRSSSAPNRPSPRQGSGSQSSSRGRDNNSGSFSGNLRDPDGPPTEKQVFALLKLTDDYHEDDVWEMTKQQVSDLISDLKG